MTGQQQQNTGSRERVERLEQDALTETRLARAEDVNAEADLELAKADEAVGKADESRELRERATSLNLDSAEHKRKAAADRREEASILNGNQPQ